jgi:hypothetical protein
VGPTGDGLDDLWSQYDYGPVYLIKDVWLCQETVAVVGRQKRYMVQ